MSLYYKSKSENFDFDLDEDSNPPFLLLPLIAGLGFFAYFTGLSLIPSIGNNVGPFEMIAFILFLVTFVFYFKNRLRVRFHSTIITLFLISVVAVLSLPNLASRIDWGLIQFALLVYTSFLVLILFNVVVQFPYLIKHLLRFATLGAFVAGVWIIYEGISQNAPIGTEGPFRNRSHVGIYLVTGFWLTLLFFYWPGVHKLERIFAVIVIFVCLYGVAVSGRRSVYLSLFIGLGILALSFFFIKGTSKFKLPVSVIIAGGILFFLAQIGSQYVPQLGFFNNRIGLIDDRLQLAVGTGNEIEDADNFIVLQREGMFRAVADHPLLGIGWGGFFESEYSPTGHEMHSTPQRFLSELGLIGFSLYMIYNLLLWFGSLRLFFRLRGTKYQLPALIFMVSLWSLAISWAYNRSVTERTYWLLIILYISFEALANMELAKLKKVATEEKSNRFGNYTYPKPHQVPPIMPNSRK